MATFPYLFCINATAKTAQIKVFTMFSYAEQISASLWKRVFCILFFILLLNSLSFIVFNSLYATLSGDVQAPEKGWVKI